MNRWAGALGATPLRFFVARLTDRRSGQLKRPAAVDLPEFQWGRRRDHLNTHPLNYITIIENHDESGFGFDLGIGNGMVVWGYQLQLVHSHNSEHPNLETGGL